MLHGGALRTQNSLFEFECGKFHSSQPLERFSSKPPNHSLSSLHGRQPEPAVRAMYANGNRRCRHFCFLQRVALSLHSWTP